LGKLGEGSFGSVLKVKYKEDDCNQDDDDVKDIFYAMKIIPR